MFKIQQIISEKVGQGKSFLEGIGDELFIGSIVFLVGFLGYGIGRYTHIDKSGRENVTIERGQAAVSSVLEPAAEPTEQTGEGVAAIQPMGAIVASSRGTKYYFPWCSGAASLSPKNKITFADEAAAKAAGYSLAASCKPR